MIRFPYVKQPFDLEFLYFDRIVLLNESLLLTQKPMILGCFQIFFAFENTDSIFAVLF